MQTPLGERVPVASRRMKWYVESIMKEQPPIGAKATPSFHVVVEAADSLTQEEQETLIELLKRRLASRRRAQVVGDVKEAQREFESGALRPTTADEIMREILS
jgi:polyphosphate kinase